MASVAISLAIAGGGMLLQSLFAPRVKQKPVDVGRNDDIRIQGAEIGAFIPRGWGKFRLAGNIIFTTGITHTIINTPSQGGKGGAGNAPATRTHVYTTTIAVLICRGAIQTFEKVWQDADLIVNNGTISTQDFLEAEDASLAGGASVDTDSNASGGEFVENLGNGGTATFTISSSLIPINPDEPPNYEPYTRVSLYYKCATNLTATLNFDSGDRIETVSFPATGADWAVKTINVPGFYTTVQYGNASAAAPDLDRIGAYVYYVITGTSTGFEGFYSVTGVPNTDILYPPDLDDPSEYYNYIPTKDGATGLTETESAIEAEQRRFYTGTLTQTQDSAITAVKTADFTSAHRGMVYAIFQDVQLKNGRVYNYTFELDEGTNTVSAIIEDVLSELGLTSADWNISALSGLTQTGFLESQNQSRSVLLDQLGRYHSFRRAEIDGKIKFILDYGSSLATIDNNDLRAHNYGEEAPAFDAEIVLKDENDLPRQTIVSVMNPNLEYHNEDVLSDAIFDVAAKEEKKYVFGIIDTPDKAKVKANILLMKEHAETLGFEFFATPKLARYTIGDILMLTIEGVTHTIRIERMQRQIPIGTIRIQAVSVEPSIWVLPKGEVSEMENVTRDLVSNTAFPRNTVVFPIQSLPIRHKDKGRLGVYLAISGRGRGEWVNAALYREYDTDNFVFQDVIDSPAALGLCEDTLATWESGGEDTTNVLDIWFFNDTELETVDGTDLTRFPTLNLIRVGDEWLQFRTATAQTLEDGSPYRRKWRISNLTRGLFGTSAAVGSHAANEYACLVTPSLRFFDLEDADVSEDITLKAVTSGQSISNAPETTFTFSPLSNWTLSNVTTDRTFDADSTTLGEVADALGTLIQDLKQ